MTYKTLISVQDLFNHLDEPDWVIVDCRFTLQDVEAGRRAYQQAHIPGAIYAHLDEDLSGPIIPGQTGRHPLPPIESFSNILSAWGIGEGTQVIAYDNAGGAIAARLWWMLRWLGHDAVAVLDGGLPAWKRADYPTTAQTKVLQPRTFNPKPQPNLLVDVTEVLACQEQSASNLFDSRGLERYRGEVEPIDPVAGHIPGAVSLPFVANLTEAKTFHPPETLRQRFEPVLQDIPIDQAIFYCGSGVTAAHNLLALIHAGLGEARLYAGSWSEWITDPNRPVEGGQP